MFKLEITYTNANLEITLDIRNLSGGAKSGWSVVAEAYDEAGNEILNGASVKLDSITTGKDSKGVIKTKCESLGLTCSFKYGGETESTGKDIAINQSQRSGATVASGTNIIITLSSGIIEKVNVPSFVGSTK